MTKFWVGVSGFSYPKWRGNFYPHDTRADGLLAAYSSRLNSVEINSSFYSVPTEKTVKKWAASVGEKFRFSFKANRQITHFKKLKGSQRETEYLLKILGFIPDKTGCLLVQLPPYLKRDIELLETFLEEIGDSTRVVLEFRDESWFVQETYSTLSKNKAALCVADTEEMKPFFQRTGDFAYARLRRDKYSERQLKDWAGRLRDHSKDSTDCYVYFKHDETGDAANLAVNFAKLSEAD